MIAIICGGRNYTPKVGNSSIEDDYKYLDSMHFRFNIQEIVSGCAKGADTLGEEWAKSRKIKTTRFPAEWDKYGVGAGTLRNTKMIHYVMNHYHRPIVIAFPGGVGTQHMMRIAIQSHVRVFE